MKLAEVSIDKRPSLIDYSATDYISLRNALIDYCKAVYPDDYKYFVESDLGIMFIELISYMGATLSMKADMLANENFLATAKQRASVGKLLQLIGIRMKGPISSAADAILAMEDTFTGQEGTVTIEPQNRVITTTSPEDGAALTFTLYKVVNGLVDAANVNGAINLDLELETSNPDAERNVFQNLVLQEGALVTDSGQFAATEANKTIRLTQSPVVEGSVQVFIQSSDDSTAGAYTEVDNIYFASGSSDKIFQVAYDNSYGATVVFGDGSMGVSPDSNAGYFITYRVGGGTRGNILKESLNYDIVTSKGTGTVKNPDPATGGQNAETLDHARRYAPLKFRAQDRLVTLEDYAMFANTFIAQVGSSAKATAVTRNAYSSANVIDVYVLEKANELQLQKATSNFKTELLEAYQPKKMATDHIVIVDGLIRTLDLVTTIRIDREQEPNQESVKAKVRNKILQFMNVDNQEFGKNVSVSDLNRAIFEVDEVRFSTLDNVGQDIRIDFNEIAQVNNVTINIQYLD